MKSNFQVIHTISEAINFLYYVLAKTRLPISPFVTLPEGWQDGQPYEQFGQRYGHLAVNWGTPKRLEDLWYSWLNRVVEHRSIRVVDALEKYPSSSQDEGVFLASVAMELLPEFLDHWPDLQSSLQGELDRTGVVDGTAALLQENETLIGHCYGVGEVRIYYNLLPTLFSQGPALGVFVFGRGYLEDVPLLRNTLRHELKHPLIEQTGVFDDAEICQMVQSLELLTQTGPFVRGRYFIQEAMAFVLSGMQELGSVFGFDEISARFHSDVHRAIGRAFYDRRYVLSRDGLSAFIRAALEDLQKGIGAGHSRSTTSSGGLVDFSSQDVFNGR